MALEAKIEDGKLIVTIELNEPRASASGKTLIVASSHGSKPTEAMVDGKVVVVGVNAYLRKTP